MLVASDNTTTVAYVNHQGGTQSMTLMDLAFELFGVAQSLGVTLKGSAHSRQAQQDRGPPISVPPDCEHRVDAPPPGGHSPVDGLGAADDRPDGNGTDYMHGSQCTSVRIRTHGPTR